MTKKAISYLTKFLAMNFILVVPLATTSILIADFVHSAAIVKSDNNDNSGANINDWNTNSLVVDYDNNSDLNTPNGYLTIKDGVISLVSWFGNRTWKYDLANSNFLKTISGFNPSLITSVHAKYLSNYERVLIFGIYNNSTSFVFQINNSDGSEYYVNPEMDNNTKITSSCLISNSNNNVITNLNSISIVGQDSAVLLPKTFDVSKASLKTIQFSLTNYASVVLNIDLSLWRTNNTNKTYLNNNVGEIFSFSTNAYNSVSYLGFKSWQKTSNLYLVYVYFVKLVNNQFSDLLRYQVAQTSSAPNLDKLYVKSVTTFANNTPINYVSCVYNDNDVQSQVLGNSKTNSTTINSCFYKVDATNSKIDFYYTNNHNFLNFDLILNPTNNQVFLLAKNTSDATSLAILDLTNSSLFTSVATNRFTYDFSNTFSFTDSITSSSRYSLSFMPIFDSYTNNSWMSGIYSLTVYSNNTDNTIAKTVVKRFSINYTNSKYSLTTSDFYAAVINSYDAIASDYANYLPQDITLDIFEKYIYLVNPDTNTKLNYESSISYVPNSLTIDNQNGTLKGILNLNVKDWWVKNTGQSSQTTVFQVPIDIQNLATNNSLAFSLVTSSDVDATKFNKINNLKQNFYPSQIAAQQILDDFLQFGDKINITVDDIAINNKNANKAINVTTDDNKGTLTITYDIKQKVSPSVQNISGTFTFNNFKNLEGFLPITLNNTAFSALKKSKAPFQITLSDLISCLNLASSYETDPKYWTWTPQYTETSNKSDYIDQNLKGILQGTISYNRELGNVPTNVNQNNTLLKIDQTTGSGFLTIYNLIGNTNSNAIQFFSDNATKIAASYTLNDVQTNFTKILDNAVSFYNNWTTIDNLKYQINSTNNNTIVFNLSFNDQITTNLKTASDTNLVLDSDWIKQINASSDILKFNTNYEFNYDLAVINFNYNLNSANSIININDLESKIDNNNYQNESATKFISTFFDENNNNYNSFQNAINLIALPTNTAAINYYQINDIQMFSNDGLGNVTISYTFYFPNAGGLKGSTISKNVLITGFKTTSAFNFMWFKIIVIITAIVCAIIILVLTSIIINKKRFNQPLLKYGKKSKAKNLNLATVDHFEVKNSQNLKRTCNTINSYTLQNTTKIDLKTNLKKYNKKIKHLKKVIKYN